MTMLLLTFLLLLVLLTCATAHAPEAKSRMQRHNTDHVGLISRRNSDKKSYEFSHTARTMHTTAAMKYLLAHTRVPFVWKPRHEGKDGTQLLSLHETGLCCSAHPELGGRKCSQAPEGQHGLLYVKYYQEHACLNIKVSRKKTQKHKILLFQNEDRHKKSK